MMNIINQEDLGIYRRGEFRQTVPLITALEWAGVKMKRTQKPESAGPARQKYKRKMISGPEQSFQKAIARARLLGRSLSEHLMRLAEEDYARDERVVMTVAEPTPEYQAFREKHPPIQLEPPPPEQSEPRQGDG